MPISPVLPETPSQTAAARWVLVSAILASSMVFIDGTALSIALPSLQSSLGASGTDLLWITNAFSLPLAALLLLGGALGDAYGRKNVFSMGILLFTGASITCGLAPTVTTLIAARAVQGLGGALMVPGALSMISTFYSREERGRAIGTWSACSVLATAMGPVLGGLLSGAGLWRWVFFINLPLAAVALAMLAWKVPGDAGKRQGRVDWWGAVSISIGLAALNYGFVQLSNAARAGYGAVLPSMTLGVLALVAFVVIQRQAPQPLLPLGLFRSRTLLAATLISLLFFLAFHGMLFLLPLNLIQVQGYDPAVAGLTQLPLMAFLILLSPVAGMLMDRFGPRIPLTLGPALGGAGFWLLGWPGLTLGSSEFSSTFLPGLLLAGAGLGLTAAPLSTTIMLSMSADRLGLASGVNSTLSRLAGVLAIGLLGPVTIVAFSHSLDIKSNTLNLPPEVRTHLLRESVKLAETKSPAGLDPAASKDIQHTIRLAFVDAFRLVTRIAAASSALAALAAIILLAGRQCFAKD